MPLKVRKVLALALILGSILLVEGGPAGGRSSSRHDADGEHGGMLQRIWSGLTTLTGLGRRDINERMEHYRLESRQRLQEEISSLLKVRGRQRRAHAHEAAITRDYSGYYKLLHLRDDVDPIFKAFAVPPNAISMVVFEHENYLFWLVTESYNQSNPGRLHVYALQVGHYLESTSVDTRGATKCVPVLLMDTFVELVCVESLGEQATDKTRIGSGVYRVMWEGGLSVTFHRALRTHGAHDVAVWTLAGRTYLAFANAYDSVRQTGEISSVVFKQQTMTVDGKIYSTYDKLDSATFGSSNARGVEAFTIVSRQFVAVANHADDLGNVEIFSDIFVYDVDRAALKPFQRIPTKGASDWKAFSFISGPDAEYFLAVANEYVYDEAGHKNFEVESVVYKYSRGKFVPFQCIPTQGAREWLVHQGPNGEFVLAVVNSQAGVFFYQYNGWRFIRSPFKASSAGVERAWISWLPKTLNEVVLAVVNPSEDAARPLVFYLDFEYRNPLALYHEETVERCSSYSGITQEGIRKLVAEVRNAPKTNDSYIFPGPVTIDGNLRLPTGLHSSQVKTIFARIPDYKVDYGFTDYESNVKDIQKALKRVAEARATVARSKKVFDSDLDGLHFSNVEFQCERGDGIRCKVYDFVVERINGASASLEEALRLDDDVLVNQSFTNVEIADGSEANIAFLSGPDLSLTPTTHLLTLTADHDILEEKTFGTIQASKLSITGTVDSVVVDEENLLLTVKKQRVSSNITSASVTTRHIQTNALNGRDLGQFYNELVLNNTSQYIEGSIVVEGDLVTPSISSRYAPTPLDPQTLVDWALFHNLQQTQQITRGHTVGELTLQRGLRVLGRVNGVAVPQELYLRHRTETITRPTTFESIGGESVWIERLLGSVKVIAGELDVFELNGKQEISGEKSFNSLTVLGHSTVTRTVSGYKIHDFQDIMASSFIKRVNSIQKIFGSVSFSDGVTVTTGTVDGVTVGDINRKALLLGTNIISTKFIFEGNVEIVGDASVTHLLNGRRSEDFVVRDAAHVLTGDVTFTRDLRVNGNIIAGSVNGMDLAEMMRLVAFTNRSQTIVHNIFLYNPGMAQLSVKGTVLVDEVQLHNLVTLNSTELVTGAKTFTTVKVLSHVRAAAVEIDQFGTVDGVVLEDLFFSNSLKKNGERLQHLVGRSFKSLATSWVTGTDFASFERSVVYKDTVAQIIAGSVTFNGPVVVNDLNFDNRFDGTSAEEYKYAWLMKTGSQTLTGVNRMKDMEAVHVTFTGNLMQGVNLEHILRNTAKTDEATVLRHISFEKLITSKEVVLDGRVQGWKLKEEAMTSNKVSQKVTGKKTFASVHYSGQFPVAQYVVVGNYLDDRPLAVDVGSLCQEVDSSADVLYWNDWTVGGNVAFKGNVTVTGTLNGEDVDTLQDIFWLTDVANDLVAVASFAYMTHGANVNLDVLGNINGQDLENLWDQVLKKECSEQVVDGDFTVETLVTDYLATDTVTNPNDDARLNGLNDILLIDGDQEITGLLNFVKVETKGTMSLDGTLNGLSIREFLRYDEPATVTSRKMFLQSVRVQGNLSLVDESTLQGVDVSELGRLAVKRTDDGKTYFIEGIKTFRGLRYDGPSFEVFGTVNGILLNKTTIFLNSEDQEMLGTLIVSPESSSVGIEADAVFVLDGQFNQMYLKRLNNFTVRSDRTSSIQDKVTILDICYFNNVTLGNSLINNYNINDLGRFINGNYLVTIGDYLSEALKAAQDTRAILADKTAEVWYYEETALDNVYKIIPVTLTSNYLEPNVYDTLVGLDRTSDLVYTYAIAPGFVRLYGGLKVLGPVAAAGLSNGILATCGDSSMNATSIKLRPTADFTLIERKRGPVSGFGHIHSLEGEVGLEAAFHIHQCRDLVSFRLKDNRLCLLVVEYRVSSTVLCGRVSSGFQLMNYLPTSRAVKGAWMNIRRETYLLVAEEESDTEPGYLKLFGHNPVTDEMQLERTVEVAGAFDVDVVVKDAVAVVAVTSRPNRLCNTTVAIFGITVGDDHIEIERLQTLEVYEAIHSSLSLLPTKQIGLFVQSRWNIEEYHCEGEKFVFVREIQTTPSLCPSSVPFVSGHPRRLMIPYTGLGHMNTDYHDDMLQLVPSTMYTALDRGHNT